MKDNAFIRGKNPMTKMEVRNAIISYLELENKTCALDIGAGTGSVTVQMGKTNKNLTLYAIEKTKTGCDLILENAKAHGVEVNVVEAEAPTEALPIDVKCDAVYIGGTGDQLEPMMTWLETHHMLDGCTVVFSVITLESLSRIMTYLNENAHLYTEVEGSQIQASRLELLGRYHYFKPLNPCYVIKCTFGGQHA